MTKPVNKRFGEWDMGTITCLVQMVDEEGRPSDEHLELKLKLTQDILDAVNKAWEKRNGKRK